MASVCQRYAPTRQWRYGWRLRPSRRVARSAHASRASGPSAAAEPKVIRSFSIRDAPKGLC
jgi:hypothetical protein